MVELVFKFPWIFPQKTLESLGAIMHFGIQLFMDNSDDIWATRKSAYKNIRNTDCIYYFSSYFNNVDYREFV